MSVAVVGSGFSGIAVAHALIARGIAVTILDVGETLDDRRSAVVSRLHDLPTSSWPPEDLRFLNENPTLGRHRLPKKVHFGSEYIYASDRSFAPIESGASSRLPYPTFAKGGYSNIWGAAVLPIAACDMSEWPVSRNELEPYFREAARLIPLTGGEGNLDESFPSYKERLGQIDAGPQGEALLTDLASARGLPEEFLYGRARLAIHTESAQNILPCNGCGYCFTGCVRGSIFSTEPSLIGLIDRHQVRYESGRFVDEVQEDSDNVRVTVIDSRSLQRDVLTFNAVFLASGPLSTTRILLRSRRLFERVVLLKESQKFVLPLLRLRAAKTAIEHPSVTLASAFIETKVPAISDHWMHAQIVPMNELILRGMPVPGIRLPVARSLLKPLLQRTMAAWCGMHSDHSAAVELMLHSGATDRSVMRIDVRRSREARVAAKAAANHLAREGRKFKTLFLPRFMQFSEPGSGTHCGGSFPMRRQPRSDFDTDLLGRPFGWERVFAVDASVLPSIPGTTLAFSVMANAYRIGALAPLGAM